MKIEKTEQLVRAVNEALGDFCARFAKERKRLAKLGRSPAQDRLFEYDPQSGRDWAINQGGGTEIQYHLFCRDNSCGYGLGFNALYVPYKNQKRPCEYMRPFSDAYESLKNSKEVESLKNAGFHFLFGNEADLPRLKDNDYFLFGRTIDLDIGNELHQEDFNRIIEDIKGPLFNLYCAIFEHKNMEDDEMKTIRDFVSFLQTEKNLILTGAPGTGKTFLAWQIASVITRDPNPMVSGNEEKKHPHIEFCQFHPSMDYTDFVEGLRPIKLESDNETFGFERRDGIFKAFCRMAIKDAMGQKRSDNFDEAWHTLLSRIDESENEILQIPLKGNKSLDIELNIQGTGLASRIYGADGNWIQGRSKFFSKEQLYRVYRGLKGVPSGGHDNYRRRIVEYMKGNCGLQEYQEVSFEKPTNHLQSYVFIIDEINRGDISKIFGELFFAIDPGYRGPKGQIKTQYDNLVDDDVEFGNGFYVPENVFIIGTMNDIDRGVESMDFAIRRRFAWREIPPEETQATIFACKDNLKNNQEAKNRMDNLNASIWKDPDLGPSFQIGGAYFTKLEGENYVDLWNIHIAPLLREYLRGHERETIETKLAVFKDAFNNTQKRTPTGDNSAEEAESLETQS